MSAGPRRDPGLQPERTSLAWRRTVLALVVVDLLVWRSWALAETRAAPGSGAGGPDYLGICALTAMVATVVVLAGSAVAAVALGR